MARFGSDCCLPGTVGAILRLMVIPAPKVGRVSRDVMFGQISYRIHPLPPRQACRVAFKIVKAFGEPLGALLSGGLDVPGGESMSLEDALGSPEGRELLLPKLLDGIVSMSCDELDDLICDLLIGTEADPALSWSTLDGADRCLVLSPEDLDRCVLGPVELMRLVKHAAEVSAFPTLADSPTSVGSSAVAT